MNYTESIINLGRLLDQSGFGLGGGGIDPRVADYKFVATPWRIITIIAVYLLFVLKYGPEWMENRKPYNLKYVISFYNACQILLNFIVAAGSSYAVYMSKDFRFMCFELTSGNMDPYLLLMIKLLYVFYLTKCLDLLDTVFFILRKKGGQKSFLHVYHHTAMLSSVFYGLRFYGASHATLAIILNASIHVIMYTYYFITSLNLNFKNQIWWKKKITLLQIIQFFLVFIHFILPFFAKDCNFPGEICLIALTQMSFLVAMFSDFYYKAYIRGQKIVKVQ